MSEENKNIEQPELEQPKTEPEVVVDPLDTEDPDWRAVRQKRKEERKALQEAQRAAEEEAKKAKALKEALEALTNNTNANKQTNYFNDTQREETEDERIDRRVAEALKKREEEYNKINHEREMQEYPSRLRKNMPDFDKVCSEDNMDYLEYHHPEISMAFAHMPDGYKKWEAVYKSAKKLIPNIDAKKQTAKVENNLKMPPSISSIPTQNSQTSGSRILTEEQKRANYERMQKAMKGLS